MKPSYFAVVLSLYAKYFLLFLFLMVKNHDFFFVTPTIREGADLFYYLWLLLCLPTLEALCFSVPLYWALKVPNRGLAAAVTGGKRGSGRRVLSLRGLHGKPQQRRGPGAGGERLAGTAVRQDEAAAVGANLPKPWTDLVGGAVRT
jgi:hypothetical protein